MDTGFDYYHNRFKDMFGRMVSYPIKRSVSMQADPLPADAILWNSIPMSETYATGSLQGIRDIFIKLNAVLTEKTSGCLMYEKVDANDSSGEGAIFPNAAEYKRLTLGLDHQYAPNTTFGIRYDTVAFDVDNINTAANAGGWNKGRLEMSVKF